MKKVELERLLKSSGFNKVREGGAHEIWGKEGFPNIPIPRHAGDIPKGTLSSILKVANIKKD